ncbi:MAG: HPF/RaiA family ribosome-associated protein, partial [Muribaculaceae bacterium]|nr:HPF/RaiA family ribosome-associated protein [Muribaculaceae bacterium]
NKEVVAKVLLPQYELVASKTADTFEEATDLAIEALKSQLEKAKNK